MAWSASFEVKIRPKGRPRFTRSGHAYTPKTTKEAEAELKELLLSKNPVCLEGALAISVTFYLKRPKSAKGRPHPTTRPDLDNLLKLVLDSGNGILYKDDSQICHMSVSKVYSEVERVTVTIFPLKDKE